MTFSGPLFYDDPAVFDTYMSRRTSATSANATLEKPILIELMPDLKGKAVLDLGCGESTLAPWLFEQGCQSYHGIDGSDNMVELAQKLLSKHDNVLVERDYIEMFPYTENTYDLVLSRLAFHYIEDVNIAFEKIFNSLRPGGDFVFSVEHPVITCNNVSGAAPRQDWVVDRYFTSGQRKVNWLGSEVFKYHRTVEDYFLSLQKAGFQVTSLRESKPQTAQFSDKRLMERRSRIPLFLFFSAHKSE